MSKQIQTNKELSRTLSDIYISAMAATNNNLYISTTNNSSYYLANFTVA